jgi:hypothetical protein
MMAGGGFTVLIPPLPKNPKQSWIVNSIYSDIMGGSAKESQLGASLHAESRRSEIFKRKSSSRWT